MFHFIKNLLYSGLNSPKAKTDLTTEPSTPSLNPNLNAALTNGLKPAQDYARKLQAPVGAGSLSLMSRIVSDWYGYARADLDDWRMAIDAAKSSSSPRRSELVNLLDRVLFDAHLASLLESRKLRVKSAKFKIVSQKTGKDEGEKSRLLEKEWFTCFLDLCLETRFYGHSLIEIGDNQNGEISYAALVPRDHVVPEFGVLLQNIHDQNGIDYRDAEFADTCLEIGNVFDLGLLAKAAPKAIMKKCMEIAWLEDGETFGAPMRIARTMSRDPKELREIDRMLDEMGHAAWARFPEGTSVDFKESSRSDAYKIYKEFIELMNSEMSKLILGQTMQTDSGSSLAQSRVHDELSDDYLNADKAFVASCINDKLFPLLIRRGYALGGYSFEWDQPSELSIKDQWAIDRDLIDRGFVLPLDYLSQNYSVPIIGMAKPDPSPTNTQGEQGLGKPNALSLWANSKPTLMPKLTPKLTLSTATKQPTATAAIANLPQTNSPQAQIPIDYWAAISDSDSQDLEAAFEDMARKVHSGDIAKDEGYLLFTQKFAKVLNTAVDDNFNIDISYEEKSIAKKFFMNLNVFIFSAAKTLIEANQLRDLLFVDGNDKGKTDGKIRPIGEFLRLAKQVHSTANVQHLRAEYNYAVAAAQMAEKWLRIEADSEEFPLLRYDAIQDERTRAEHAALDGVTLLVTDKFWNKYFPPNGWNCRCDVLQLEKGELQEASIPKTPLLFQNNVGKSGIIFTEAFPYYQQARETSNWQKALPSLIRAFNEDLYKRKYTNENGNFVDVHPMVDKINLPNDLKMSKILMNAGYNVRLRYNLAKSKGSNNVKNPDLEIMIKGEWIIADFKSFKKGENLPSAFERTLKKTAEQAEAVVYYLNPHEIKNKIKVKLTEEDMWIKMNELVSKEPQFIGFVFIYPNVNDENSNEVVYVPAKMAMNRRKTIMVLKAVPPH